MTVKTPCNKVRVNRWIEERGGLLALCEFFRIQVCNVTPSCYSVDPQMNDFLSDLSVLIAYSRKSRS